MIGPRRGFDSRPGVRKEAMYRLYIANKNYSSWSLRPWLLMREREIPFEEQLLRFPDPSAPLADRSVLPSGKVPCLVDGDITVWDSLAIAEYLAERHDGVWPEADPAARAFARSAAAEMHSGFDALRSCCGMNCGLRIRLNAYPDALARDVARVSALWDEGLRRFDGPFLAGRAFTAVDAFFAPVAFRIQTYGLTLASPAATAYAEAMLARPFMKEWYEAGIAEPFREAAHEAEFRQAGTILEDHRVPPS